MLKPLARKGIGYRRSRRLLQLATFGVFALGNPLVFVACSSNSEDAYEYDQADMVAVASGLDSAGPYQVGEYSVTVQFPFANEHAANATPSAQDAAHGSSSSVGVAPAFFARAHACGTRSFVQPAAACIDASEMQLQATLRVERDAKVVELEMTGNMRVDSRILTFADFYFAADSLLLSFAWSESQGYRYVPGGTDDAIALDALFAR